MHRERVQAVTATITCQCGCGETFDRHYVIPISITAMDVIRWLAGHGDDGMRLLCSTAERAHADRIADLWNAAVDTAQVVDLSRLPAEGQA